MTYSVCITFLVHKNAAYVIDVLRQKLIYPELKKQVLAQKAKFAADTVLIEDTGHGTALIQELRGSGLLHAIGIRPRQGQGHAHERPIGQDRSETTPSPLEGPLA